MTRMCDLWRDLKELDRVQAGSDKSAVAVKIGDTLCWLSTGKEVDARALSVCSWKLVQRKGRWAVNVFGEAGRESFEIAVVRDDNEHGKLSYGWFSENKLLITHNGGPCRWPLTQRIWDKQMSLAEEVALELNNEEKE